LAIFSVRCSGWTLCGLSISVVTGLIPTTGFAADPYLPREFWYGYEMRGTVGKNGKDASACNSPSGGGNGSAPAALVYSTDKSLDYSSDGYGTGFVAKSFGGEGGAGGNGGTYALCNYDGRGGGRGGDGGTVNMTYGVNWVPSMVIPGTGMYVTSTGGKGGDGGRWGPDSGNGGAGGNGGYVTIYNKGTITTSDDNGFGLFGFSQGGNGGKGGGGEDYIVGSGGGGGGGLGGAGGNVSIENNGTIETANGYGIVGASLGGRGGNGGSSKGTLFSTGDGGNGGPGGAAGNITIGNGGSVTVNMDNNVGILGLTVGGGGGDAGAAAGLTQLGATGGPGASPGQVWINNAGTIQTNGQYSPGLIAASVGGGGGRGGMKLGVVTTIGGSGGDGGNGGNAFALNGGTICTGGPCKGGAVSSSEPGLAPGILAASIGGGGGMGGYGQSGGFGGTIGIGGKGGKGGKGNTVGISAPGSVYTRETVSPGIMGISIGGGGGMGGGAVAMSAGYSSTSVGIGGTGGSGGDGGMVNINCGSNWSGNFAPCKDSPYPGAAYDGSVVMTKGIASPGILGMSVGGGGGMGGFALSASAGLVNSQSFSVGGAGGPGGNAGEVYVANNGSDVTTSGKLSGGVVALSVGGRGGFGGFAFDGAVAGATSIGFALGGKGGGGGFGNRVGVENAKGTIKTTGDVSAAMVGMSVGGGGGMGGVAASLGGAVGLSINSSVGGNGGSGNYAGTVNAQNLGTLVTTGKNSWGMVGASIGGGGGMGGFALGTGVALGGSVSVTGGGDGGSGGNANYVDMQNDGTIRVLGQGGAGMLAASIGGGGGMGGGAISADVALGGAFTSSTGGKGGAGAAAGNVDARNTGKIDMTDDGETKSLAFGTQGIVALSIGGGGGMGGLSIAGSITGVGGSVTDSVGGGSAGGGTGGNASINQYGGAYVRTRGALSNGLTAISMGGRGGMGGIAVAGSLTGGSSATVAVGGDAGNAGKAGQAYVWNAGEVTTDGLRSLGILAQSIGGHGGVGGMSLGLGAATGDTIMASTVSIGGDAGNGGSGHNAIIETGSASNVTTKGALSAGLSAQSIGGNGGMGGAAFAASATTGISPSLTLGGQGGSGSGGGTAWINSNGQVTTEGAFSPGVLSQSIGGNGGMGGISIAAGSSADKTGNSTQRLGGSGGTGASGGDAVVNNWATVVTKGAMSDGVSVESFGGSGGRAGLTISAPLVNTGNLSARDHNANLGGDSGGGGNGGKVQAYHGGIISTSGAFSSAVSAQSVGGGGGMANALWADISWGGKKTTTTMGADRGANGNGGVVVVEANKGLTSQKLANGAYSNSLIATGIHAHGVFAQSLGGGGGRGGALNTQSSAGGAVAALQNLGSAGTSNDWGTAGGGSAGDVTVSTGGLIYAGMSAVPGQRAAGFNAGGILAQSIGGGGGASSHIMDVETTLDVAVPGTNLQITAGGGSATSSNGSSGTATNKPSTTVSLSNFSSTTITAGSLSSMALGGYSQAGGSAGRVTIESTSVIQTVGALSDGILAQSIGGGGGSATFADVNSSSPYAAGTATLGGGAGGIAKGADVTVTSSGPIQVKGPGSAGIRAQSIGAGGGNSGHLSQTSGAGLSAAFTAGLGANGAPSGSVATAGTVSVTVNGPVYFSGVGSDGVVAQSIAGGGGNVLQFGLAQSALSGATSLSSSASAGSLSEAVQSSTNSAGSGSTGGGSGGAQVGVTGGASVAGALGASAGQSRDAGLAYILANGTVAADDTGSLLARNSTALMAQSIGGGGGQIRYFDSNFDGRQSSLSFTLGASGSTTGSGGWAQVTQGWTAGSTAYVETLGDNSTAALVQSIGGGGGEARITRITTGSGGSRSAALMLGARGTAGGKGQDAVLQLGGAVTTGGNSSSAGVVQSIGGGGGFARMAILAGSAGTVNSTSTLSASGGASASSGLAFTAVLGSQSSGLATGGKVGFESIKALTTDGARSTAVIAQSIGGGGGVADIVSAGADTGGVASSVVLGARNAGGSGAVTATTRGDVTTKGSSSHGVVAQSIGGGGGMAGVTTTGAGAAQNASLSTQFGDRDASGDAGAVTIDVQSSVTTNGAMSFGLLAQSIASGGGLASHHLMSGAGATQTQETVTFGSGPATFAGAALASSNFGATKTQGFGSIGVMAQSYAGGGGVSATMIDKSSGDSTIRFSSSLERVTAGTAGSATAANTTYVETTGDIAHGLVAQSGVAGGLVMSRYLTASGASATIDLKTGSGITNTAVGQGTSGTAGAAKIETNYVDTSGAAAFGAVAQSVPFGGLYTIVTASTDGSLLGSLGGSISLGAAGVSTAGSSTINSGPSVSTRGAYAIGLLAQSIGGGGGAVVLLASNAGASTAFNPSMSFGNSAQGTAGATSVTATGSVTTEGPAAHGVLAQSIGGGGGYLAWTGASSGSLAMGSGSSNGAGGAVSVNMSGAVSTKGSLSMGVIAQSVGGGGGLAQGTFTSTATLGGGNSSANNTGGAIDYTQSGSLTTTGVAGIGVLLQSVGGGGGVVFGNARLGGGAGNTANGGAIRATITGSITTSGDFGIGVMAQSVGGGGGLIVSPGSTATPASQSGSGSGAAVTVTATGATIRTTGKVAHGIVAQSVGGGGGLAVTNAVNAVSGGGSGSKGSVTINATNGTDVVVSGAGASAVKAFGSVVNVDASSRLLGGSEGGAAVSFVGDSEHIVNNFGLIGSTLGAAGFAVIADEGATSVSNAGLLQGSIDLAPLAANRVNNLSGGLIEAGSILNLGAAGLLVNAGVLQPGGGVIGGVTTITGGLEQTSEGLLQFLAQPGGGAARLIIGGKATLSGKLGLQFVSPGTVKEGRFEHRDLIVLNGEFVDGGLSANRTAIVDSRLVVDGDKIGLDTTIDFSPTGLSGHGARLGSVLGLAQERDGSLLQQAVVVRLLGAPDVESLERAYSDLAANPVSSVLQAGLQAAQAGMASFAEQADRWRNGETRPDNETSQAWITPRASSGNFGASSGSLSAHNFAVSAGMDVQISPDLLVGFGALGGQNELSVQSSSMTANQDAGGAGLYGMARFGQAYLSAAAYVGVDRSKLARSYGRVGSGASTLDGTVAGARAEFGYTFAAGEVRLTPFIAFEPAGRWQDGASESVEFAGAREAGLTYESQFSHSLPVIAGMQFDADLKLSSDSIITTYLRGGFAHELNTSRELTKSLPGLRQEGFTSGGDYAADDAAFVHLGVLYKASEQISIFADVSSQLAEQGDSFGGRAGIQVRW
jgi:hypothetical protein